MGTKILNLFIHETGQLNTQKENLNILQLPLIKPQNLEVSLTSKDHSLTLTQDLSKNLNNLKLNKVELFGKNKNLKIQISYIKK